MQQRSTRGIQYEDVAQAADTLLQEGMRPTIERIRLHIGRGSPNTVSPMLEQWFAGLGRRLGGASGNQKQTHIPGQGAGIPDAVVQMAQTLWEKASADAQSQSEKACADERARLEVEAQRLHEAGAQLEARELAMNERLDAMKTALLSCQQQLVESNAHWQTSVRSLAARDAEIAANKSDLEQGRSQATALQQSLNLLQEQMLEERNALEERHRATELRWLAEVDRARQEARKYALQAEQSNHQRSALQQEADNLRSAQHTKELEQALHTSALRHELATALQEARQSELLLQKMQASKEAWQAQEAQRIAFKSESDVPPNRPRRTSFTSQRTVIAPVRRSLKKMQR